MAEEVTCTPGGGGAMMSQMDRISNPWDGGDMMEEGYGGGHHMNMRGRGRMMNTRGRGMMRPSMTWTWTSEAGALVTT